MEKKLLFSKQETISKFSFILKQELNLTLILSSKNKYLELSLDKEGNNFVYILDDQRRHENYKKLNIPSSYSYFETKCVTNPSVSTIKGYLNKIKKLSYFTDNYIRNITSLGLRCFHSGHLINYILSRKNVIHKKKIKDLFNRKIITRFNKLDNNEISFLYKLNIKDNKTIKEYKNRKTLGKRLLFLTSVLLKRLVIPT